MKEETWGSDRLDLAAVNFSNFRSWLFVALSRFQQIRSHDLLLLQLTSSVIVNQFHCHFFPGI